jgi:hypothetical protein
MSGYRWLLICVLTAISASGAMPNQAARYGANIPYRLGQPIQHADVELTFRGGGTTASGYVQREYWAFRVFSRTGAQLVLFYPPVAGKTPVPVRFRTAGLWFRLLADNREPGPWDGLLSVTKESSKP